MEPEEDIVHPPVTPEESITTSVNTYDVIYQVISSIIYDIQNIKLAENYDTERVEKLEENLCALIESAYLDNP
jgi:hypothetical protein